jgi:hypothetical protein
MIANQNTNAPAVELPRYQSHKIVRALKILAVDYPTANPGATLVPEAGFAPFAVAQEYLDKHKPQAGGYYVVYDDGYTSFSPAKAFEDGYTRIQDEPHVNPADDKLQHAGAGAGTPIKRVPAWPFPDGSAT